MQDSDQEDFRIALRSAAETFGLNLSPERVLGYWRVLRGYPKAPLIDAIRRSAVECDRFPVPRKLVDIMQHQVVPDNRPSRYVLAPSWRDDQGRWYTRKLKPGEWAPAPESEYVTPGHDKRAFPLIKKLGSTIGSGGQKRSPAEYAQLLEEISAMERDFPGLGWAETYQELAQLWASSGKLRNAGTEDAQR